MKSIPEFENTVYIQHTISVSKNIEKAFAFFINNQLSKYYTEISDDHIYLTVRTGEKLKVGSIMDCAEATAKQSVTHKYVVAEIITNQRIYCYSKPSTLKIKLPWQTMDRKCNTYVFFDFESPDSNLTNIRLTIGIQFFSPFMKYFSLLCGSISPWKKHCVEETEGLKRIMELQMQ